MNRSRNHSPPRRRRACGERAASLVEYAMMIALIAVVCIAAVSYFGGQGNGSLNNSQSRIVNAG